MIKQHLIKQSVRDRFMDVFSIFSKHLNEFSNIARTNGQHLALCGNYSEILNDSSVNFSAVYADPPYTRDHYSRFYHVLETMAQNDDPDITTSSIRSNCPRLSKGLYRYKRHQSPFSIKSKAQDAFTVLFKSIQARKTPLVLSYSPYKESTGNRPRLLTINELLNIARNYFSEVKCLPINDISHSKLNLVAKNTTVDYCAEVLLICKP